MDINGYVTGLPLGQEWDLASRWTPLVTTDPGDVATTVATAGDGTVWEAVTYNSYSLLETYVPSTGAHSVVLYSHTPITSIAALSSNQGVDHHERRRGHQGQRRQRERVTNHRPFTPLW